MKKIVTALLIISSFTLNAKVTYGKALVSEVVSIYDGDTFRVNIDGYPDILGLNMPIRINGVDTPEMRGKCKEEKDKARLAKQFTVASLRSGKVIELRNMTRGKYFRIAADVYIDGTSLGKQLVNGGHAVVYDGKKKSHDWCVSKS